MRHNDFTRMDTTPTGGVQVDRDDNRARDAKLVDDALAGDQAAFGRLYDSWYDRVWNVALRIVHDPEVAAEVAQDAFLSAWRSLGTLENTEAFGGWLLRIARNASFNRQRKEGRSRPVDDEGLAVIESTSASPVSAPTGFGVEDRARAISDPATVAEDGELVALVRESAGALGERDAEVLDLQLRYGLSPAEIGEVMGMNRNAANQLCHRIRQRFATAVRARVLWRGERPACDALAQMLTSAGIAEFDSDAVKIAEKHAEACPQCTERRELRLQPSAMFAAVPLVAAPVLLKQQTAHALEAAGVVMDGSSFSSSDGAGGTSDGDGGGQGDGRGRRHRARRSLVMALVAAVVLVVAVVALANRTDDGTIDELAVSAPSTLPTTTTVAPTVPIEAPTTTQAITDVTIEGPPPATDSTPPPIDTSTPDTPGPVAPTIQLRLTDTTIGDVYAVFDAPRLIWSVVGAASVRVEEREDAAGAETVLLREESSGDMPICPGNNGQWSFCTTSTGDYDYTLRAFDGAGNEIGRRTVTLTVGF